jgi:hypothetical protein
MLAVCCGPEARIQKFDLRIPAYVTDESKAAL